MVADERWDAKVSWYVTVSATSSNLNWFEDENVVKILEEWWTLL